MICFNLTVLIGVITVQYKLHILGCCVYKTTFIFNAGLFPVSLLLPHNVTFTCCRWREAKAS